MWVTLKNILERARKILWACVPGRVYLFRQCPNRVGVAKAFFSSLCWNFVNRDSQLAIQNWGTAQWFIGSEYLKNESYFIVTLLFFTASQSRLWFKSKVWGRYIEIWNFRSPLNVWKSWVFLNFGCMHYITCELPTVLQKTQNGMVYGLFPLFWILRWSSNQFFEVLEALVSRNFSKMLKSG